LPFIERGLAGRTIKILLDTGAAKSYVKPLKELKNIMLVGSPFTVSSVHGSSTIKEKCFMHIFGLKAPFFLLDTINTFDAIIGFDLLTQAGAALELRNSVVRYGNISEQLKYHECDNVGATGTSKFRQPSNFRKGNHTQYQNPHVPKRPNSSG